MTIQGPYSSMGPLGQPDDNLKLPNGVEPADSPDGKQIQSDCIQLMSAIKSGKSSADVEKMPAMADLEKTVRDLSNEPNVGAQDKQFLTFFLGDLGAESGVPASPYINNPVYLHMMLQMMAGAAAIAGGPYVTAPTPLSQDDIKKTMTALDNASYYLIQPGANSTTIANDMDKGLEGIGTNSMVAYAISAMCGALRTELDAGTNLKDIDQGLDGFKNIIRSLESA